MFFQREIIGRVVDDQDGSVTSFQANQTTRRVDRYAKLDKKTLIGYQLSRLTVIGCNQDQGFRMRLGERQRTLKRLFELLQFADRAARVPDVGLLVDRSRLDGEKETLAPVPREVAESRVSHLLQRWHSRCGRVRLAGHRFGVDYFSQVAVERMQETRLGFFSGSSAFPLPTNGHMTCREQSQELAIPGCGVEFRCQRDDVEAVLDRSFENTVVFAFGLGCEMFLAAAQHDIHV